MPSKICIAILAMMAASGLAVPSPTCPTPPTQTCKEPPNQTTGYPNYDLFCHCSPYNKTTTWGNPYLGLVTCDTKCTPKKPEQREAHNDKATSLSDCMKACTGSFEKVKRRSDDNWFCHGVNFIEGQLCEFIGSLGKKTLEPGSKSHCLYIDGLD
ncbi:hypothetical protein F4777DRAFT_213029 [Nemania sp. FL0916]|nr:hypothetical protein F4777DRAFT_213029 [Nemania sp. FL0916]